MCRTNAASQFADSGANRLVLSWLNRRNKASVNNDLSANFPTTSTTYVEVNSTLRTNFLVWAGDEVDWKIAGSVAQQTGGVGFFGIGYDGVNAEPVQHLYQNLTAGGLALASCKAGLTEGWHYGTILIASSAGGNAVIFGGVPNATSPDSSHIAPTLTISVQG
jgi:hypothetical protein